MSCRTPLAGLLLAAAPGESFAHGFAQRYDLPVPLALYLGGAGAAVALSFAVIALFVRGERIVASYPRWNLLRTRPGRILAGRFVTGILRALSVVVLGVVVAGGFSGPENPFENIAPTAIWVVWWVGFAYISGLVGNLWALVNPWAAVFRWGEWLRGWFARMDRRDVARKARSYNRISWPEWLGCWPAVALFVAFVWCELIWPQSDHPASLATAVLAYSGITWLGMFVFGRQAWLRGGEAFSVAFGLLARFAPTEIRVTDPACCASCNSTGCADAHAGCVNCLDCFERASPAAREFNLRPWAVGLLAAGPIPVSATAFVLVMLASVTFDGLLATPLWASLAGGMLYSESLRPVLLVLQEITGDAVAAVGTIALLVFLTGFQLIYLLFCALMRLSLPAAHRERNTVRQLAAVFVLSLVPIALAYHLAHYLSYLAIVGQYLIPLASDPFGLGWDLFGTRLYRVDIGIINARFVWFTSVIAIVAGHIVAVWLAHVTALRLTRENRAALRSQIPMLLLMVGYTVLSLWILAQPIVEL